MRTIGEAIAKCAAEEWQKQITDIPNGTEWIEGIDPDNPDEGDPERIVHYHEVSGADWATNDGYQEYEDFWCGVFAGFCATKVGDFLHKDRCVDLTLAEGIGKHLFPSTVRLTGRGPKSWEELGYPKPEMIDPVDIQPGDFPIVSTDRTNRSYGDHITIARKPAEDGFVRTYEGNARGKLPEGHGEGVVKGQWSFGDIGVVLRLRSEHLVGDHKSEVFGD